VVGDKDIHNPVAERKAFALLEGIVKENSNFLRLEGDKLVVTRPDGDRYFIDLNTSKVYNASGRFICIRVLSPSLPVVDQVLAKSLHLLASPRHSIELHHDLMYKVTFAGLDPVNEWPWIRSFTQTSLGNTFSTLIGADFAVKEMTVRGLAVKLQLWYVNYSDRFESVRVRHIRGSTGAVILRSDHPADNDVENLQASIDELRSCNERRLPMMFIGLYDDTSNQSYEINAAMKESEEIAKRRGIPFFACSVNHPATTIRPLTYLTEMIVRRESRRRVIPS
jgi:GTPase SAR1 family protein